MILITSKTEGYELIDSGDGLKLERYGDVIMCRPDPEAIWKKSLPETVWNKAHATFIRKGKTTEWRRDKSVPEMWPISFGEYTFAIRPTTFKHTGLFPEQLPNWQWMSDVISKANRPIKVLNLFAYTGGATLACANAGAEVVHVDASKVAVSWARENAELSGLTEKPIRWIVDDVLLFLKREVKRGNTYDAIIMDPPSFGHGPNDELWKIEEHLMELIDLCKKLLSPSPLFVLINGYTAGYSPIAYKNVLEYLMKDFGGSVEIGELAIEESESKRLLPAGIIARWTN